MAVYVLTDGTHYKIGYALSPESRVKALQTGNANVLRIVGILNDADQGVEDHLHLRFAHKRCPGGGEWFNLDQTDLQTIFERTENENNFGSYRENYNSDWVRSPDVRPFCGGHQDPTTSRSEDVFLARREDDLPPVSQHHVVSIGKKYHLSSKDDRR